MLLLLPASAKYAFSDWPWVIATSPVELAFPAGGTNSSQQARAVAAVAWRSSSSRREISITQSA